MLVGCPPGCSGKQAETEALLNVKTNEVICTKCGDIIPISSFMKKSMKSQGEVLKESKKAFSFDCSTCELKVPAEIKNGKLVGVGCSKDCKFNVSRFAIQAMEVTSNDS